jgi:tetratricopeptide (TPR) repeat protein
MQLEGKKPNFRPVKKYSNPFRLMLWTLLIVIGFVVMRGYYNGSVKPLFLASPTPTRTTNSYAQEGQTDFTAGDLEKAIVAYKKATALDPNDAQLWAQLARIQTYSSVSLTTNEEQLARLQDALDSINHAAAVAPQDSTVHAIRAFVLDWYANPVLVGDQVGSLLTEAQKEASLALAEDQTNTLAQAFYAEIMVDQNRWDQAELNIKQAELQDSTLMDVHRIYGYVYETLGQYNFAIQEYKQAIEIAPNLTFLKIRVGKIYRHLQLWDQALAIFDLAAKQNQQLGINDPIPYLAIANTYMQTGDFFAAARNVKKAMALNPSSPDVYAQLGMVYHSSRNYEGAIPAFECAIQGCDAEKSCQVRYGDQCDMTTDPPIVITGMKLTSDTVPYYYTFVSVLSGLHRPGVDSYCIEAAPYFAQIKDGFSGDPTIMSIVKAGEDICAGG